MKNLPSLFLIFWISISCFIIGLVIGKEIQKDEIYSVEHLTAISMTVIHNKLENSYTCYKSNIEVPCPGKLNEK